MRPAKFGQVDNVVTQAKNFGERTEVFNGVDLTINARFHEGGLLAGGVSFGRTSIDECSVNPDSPMAVVGGVLRSYDFCRSTPPWTNETRIKLAGAYSLRLPRIYEATTTLVIEMTAPKAVAMATCGLMAGLLPPVLGCE